MAKEGKSADSVYKVTEVIGTSAKSWEDAAKSAVETASGTLRDLRIAEVVKMDVKIEGGKVLEYRTRLQLSFKYESRKSSRRGAGCSEPTTCHRPDTHQEELRMIHIYSLGRAARYFPERMALVSNARRSTFRELDARVGRIAAALRKHGFKAGDRLAILLPNEPDYIELVYACAWLGVIALPLNTRLSVKEIDGILDDAKPRGLIRHSSLPVPTVQVSWQLVLDQEPLEVRSDSVPDPIYDPDAILALIYTSGTTGRPKGVEMRHANILENVYHTNFWFPLEEGAVHLHAAPIFHIADFPFMFAAPAFGTCQITVPKFNPQTFCETVQRERVTHTVLVPTMINMLTQFPELQKYDLSSLRHLGYGGSPMAPELVHRTRQVLPNVKLVQVYGLSEAGFLTGLLDHEHTEDKLTSCGRPCLGIDVHVVDPTGKEVETGQTGELVARGANIMRSYWNQPKETKLAFRNGFFRTGDIGYQDANGYFYILDRLKDM